MPASRGPLRQVPSSALSVDDPFFAGLGVDYRDCRIWFQRKRNEPAWVPTDQAGRLLAFLYLKVKSGPIADVDPPMPTGRRLKIGTFKVEAYATRLGERLLKVALDEAIASQVDAVYVTAFPKHGALVRLFTRYGFQPWGIKVTDSGSETVLLKGLKAAVGDVLRDYPQILVRGYRAYLLAIYPDYHTRLFPDSILRNESGHVI